MTFARVWLTGISDGQPATGAKLTQLDINVSRCFDGAAGGKVTPTAPVIVAGAGIQIGDTNEPARFSTVNAKWIGAATDFAASESGSYGVLQDLTASFDRIGTIIAVSSSANHEIYTSLDDGFSWVVGTSGGAFVLRCITSAPANTIVAGDSANGQYSVDDFASVGGAFTFPGTPTNIHCLHYDAFNSRYIAIGKTAGAPYAATATIANPPVATQRTVPAAITGSNNGISIAQNPATGRLVASWAGQTKFAYSDDGITWTASTTVLTAGDYIVRYGDGVFVAIDKTTPSSNFYVSTDGITWSQTGITSPTSVGNAGSFCFDALNGVFMFASTASSIFASSDKGLTWTKHTLSHTSSTACKLVRAKNKRFFVAIEGVTTAFVHRSRKLGLINGSA